MAMNKHVAMTHPLDEERSSAGDDDEEEQVMWTIFWKTFPYFYYCLPTFLDCFKLRAAVSHLL